MSTPDPTPSLTVLPSEGRPSFAPGSGPTIPGYEVLEELGRGGMGVVYKARQTALKRLVALKMILHAQHAGSDARDRFYREAEAIARLQHPNIVQVHDIGEHDGLPYFSLEFCPGGSLADRLHGTPLPANQAAQLIETLARAMHAAHGKGLIHRDLKPANILLAEDGTPRISDFGLVRAVDEAGHTHQDAILGSPSYMPPEQAGRRGGVIGPAADVYSLGAILYECLTGRPPFRAATTMETILQVLQDEPVSPRRLQSATPQDLETICLKCLQKDQGKRYADAETLADDLRRFQEGRPILARPAGRIERTWRWCRRNPALAASLATVALTLMLGTVVATWFALESAANEHQAELNAEEEGRQRRRADLKAEEAQRNEHAANEAKERAQLVAARGLLRPMGQQREGVTVSELDALWELATLQDDTPRLLFVEQALRSKETAAQLLNRVEEAIHAAVGLNDERREQVLKVLRPLAHDEKTGPETRRVVLRASVSLGERDPATLQALVTLLLDDIERIDRGIAANDYLAAFHALTANLKTTETESAALKIIALLVNREVTAPRLEPLDGVVSLVRLLGPARAREMAFILSERFTGVGRHSYRAGVFKETATRLSKDDVPAVAERLVARARETKSTECFADIVEAFAALTTRLDSKRTRAGVSALVAECIRLLPYERLSAHRVSLDDAAVDLAAGMSKEDAAALADAIERELPQRKRLEDLTTLSSVFRAVAGRLEPERARKMAEAIAEPLTRRFGETTIAIASPATEFVHLAEQLDPVQARQRATTAAALLVEEMGKTSRLIDIKTFAVEFKKLIPLMEPAEARTLAEKATTTIGRLLTAADRPADLRNFAQAFNAVSRPLGDEAPARAKPLVAQVVRQILRTTHANDFSVLGEAFAALAERLPDDEASKAARAAVAHLLPHYAGLGFTLADPTRSISREALRSLTGWLAPEEAHLLAVTIVRAVSSPINRSPDVVNRYRNALGMMVQRLDVGQTEAVVELVLKQMQQVGGGLFESLPSEAAADLLVVLADKIGMNKALATADVLLKKMRLTPAPLPVMSQARGIAALLRAVDPAEARQRAREAIAYVNSLLAAGAESSALSNFGTAIGDLAASLTPEDAALLAPLTARLRESDPASLGRLTRVLIDLADRIDGDEFQRLARIAVSALLDRLGRGSTYGMKSMTDEYRMLSSRLDVRGLSEALKHPCCVGPLRRIALDQLSARTKQSFGDVWDFVAWARQHEPSLDLSSPPKR